MMSNRHEFLLTIFLSLLVGAIFRHEEGSTAIGAVSGLITFCVLTIGFFATKTWRWRLVMTHVQMFINGKTVARTEDRPQ